MSTQKHCEANLRNAHFSPGANPPAGKAASAHNSLRYGIFASDLTLVDDPKPHRKSNRNSPNIAPIFNSPTPSNATSSKNHLARTPQAPRRPRRDWPAQQRPPPRRHRHHAPRRRLAPGRPYHRPHVPPRSPQIDKKRCLLGRPARLPPPRSRCPWKPPRKCPRNPPPLPQKASKRLTKRTQFRPIPSPCNTAHPDPDPGAHPGGSTEPRLSGSVSRHPGSRPGGRLGY